MASMERPTLRVSNIPQSAIAKELLEFFDSLIGSDSVFAVEIVSERKNWKSKGFGRVQFETLEAKSKALSLSLQNNLTFKAHYLSLTESHEDIIIRPLKPQNRLDNGVLHVGFMVKDNTVNVLESWEGVRAWVMPERTKVEFWVWVRNECYKLEIGFEDIFETIGYSSDDGKLTALLLKLKYAPKIYQKKAGPDIASKFSADRYHICKEDFEYLWVRSTDFSLMKSIGLSTSFCLEIVDELSVSDIFQSFPLYREDSSDVVLEDGKEFGSSSEMVPLVKCDVGSKVHYKILFQLNSLVHAQKISLASVDDNLFHFFCDMSEEIAFILLQKLHKLSSTCYEPLAYVKTQLHVIGRSCKKPTLLPCKQPKDKIMSCHRALITPSKIYCIGPELETSNYVVKHFSDYASDFMRITFVEEDWSKLPAGVISTSILKGTFSKPFKTKIDERILSILRDGIVIGAKRFEFLAFSASQLRSNSVWMFASNDNVKVEDIRKWMGCFSKIRSISKCAARMGQLFSSSTQTLVVPAQDVETISDVEVVSNGTKYCFSDGIGKISLTFARQIAEKCGLKETPSAFQIRYGGYKGVVAVDRHSFRKLSLRNSMLKFESKNRMLNVTKWSDSMPCFLNREIISLLSTLGIEDEVFEAMLQEHLCLLGKMLTNKEAALHVMESLNGADSRNILVKMLLQGYEPDGEVYLSMMLRAYYENLLSDLKSRSRIFVPKGRILIGCLDETCVLDYGQVYVRLTMTKAELQCENQCYFRKVDDKTCVLEGKVIVTRNPCLHPGDIRVLEAVYDIVLEEKGLVDCLVFPQKGERPHPNECSGGDLDGDLYFISWDSGLIPCQTEPPMDYTGPRPRIMDHEVTLEEIRRFFVDYMINDNLGAISTAHLVHSDCEPDKAKSRKCLELASLHSMAVDFAKTGVPAEMPRTLKPTEFPDFMERFDKPMYTSKGVLGKLYHQIIKSMPERSKFVWSEEIADDAYDHELEVSGFEAFLETAESHKEMYAEKLSILMNYYRIETEAEILTGNLLNRESYLLRDNRRYGEMKDRILLSVKSLRNEAKEWFENSCHMHDYQKMASAWYHVTYHPTYYREETYLSFPWVVGDILIEIKSANSFK